MRLVCPNCDAEYEVDDTAIPRDGRDVQCSNCGHAWFQQHPEIEAEAEAEADLYEAPAGAVAPAADEDEQADVPVDMAATKEMTPEADTDLTDDADEDEDESEAAEPDADQVEPEAAAPADANPPPSRSLDETVLAVLREEADRETAARRAEVARPPMLESQTEMPMAEPAVPRALPQETGMAAAVRRIARMRGLGAAPAEAAEPAVEKSAKSRGQMFPAIDEINSTLRTIGDRAQDENDAVVDSLPDLNPPKGGFRRGFLTLVVLAALIVGLYLWAPVIATKYPAMAGVAAAYVSAVDVARAWLDTNLRLLVAKLQDLAGNQGG